jgi:hypothetical protein
MDPLSIAASAITLLGAADAVGAGIQQLLSLRQAPSRLLSLQHELADFVIVLNFVQDALVERSAESRIPHAEAAGVQSALQRGDRVVSALRDVFERKLTKSPQNETVDVHVRYRGFLKQQRFEQIGSALRDARIALGTALAALNYHQG